MKERTDESLRRLYVQASTQSGKSQIVQESLQNIKDTNTKFGILSNSSL
jgi:hypothetical protein